MNSLRREEGLTLLEIVVVTSLGALILGPLAILLWQLNVLPLETSGGLRAAAQVRNLDITIFDDARSTQSLDTGDDPLWATVAWTNHDSLVTRPV